MYIFRGNSLSAEDKALYHEYKTFKSFWEHLKVRYTRLDRATAQHYVTEIQTFEMKPEESIRAAYDRLKGYRSFKVFSKGFL